MLSELFLCNQVSTLHDRTRKTRHPDLCINQSLSINERWFLKATLVSCSSAIGSKFSLPQILGYKAMSHKEPNSSCFQVPRSSAQPIEQRSGFLGKEVIAVSRRGGFEKRKEWSHRKTWLLLLHPLLHLYNLRLNLCYLSCSYATKFLPCTTEQGKPDTQMLLQFDGT
ncbi:hypothetical protein DEO72_LG3g2481 [Vigna unguiculata]|uniref:Uncharacterized protein n=1 Tax=Vigna unguiculata TaxID=3917 RepID=A0A4D6LH69_VIGUN|nr:hypothetical protein DEO72_LG3g2481 [Vigna unguiculata]